MSTPKQVTIHRILLYLITLFVIGLAPGVASAQEGSNTIYLPVVVHGPPADDNPIDEGPIGDGPINEEENELAAMSAGQLPEPTSFATAPGTQPTTTTQVTTDNDGDGVPNEKDNCPFMPNAPVNGVQLLVCGKSLPAQIDEYLFLASRTVALPTGLDPHLANTQKLPRIHVLLHMRPLDNGVLLPPQWRQALEAEGVKILDYLPHNTFYVSLPREEALLRRLVALEQIRGISAIQPQDKVAPQLRLAGPVNGRNSDGSFTVAVDLYDDVTKETALALLNSLAPKVEHAYDGTYHVTLGKWSQLQRLAMQDIVYWIDDMPDEVFDRTQDGQALIGGQNVTNRLGYRGNGIVLSMTESGLAEPTNHQDMDGRITLGNNPILEPDFGSVDHPQMTSAIMIADETTFPDRAGFLPEGELISYSTIGLTVRAQHFGVNEEARADYGALLSSNSWGPANCNKRGEYRKRGKYFDRTVYDVGMTVVYAAGNTRGPNGLFAEKGCESELYSLPHPVAKNDISVGNWSLYLNTIARSSSAGPAADGRLKPDVVAPGQGIDTIGWNENTLRPEAIQGGGTSAAAPVVSGVVGWLAESFINQGETILDIPPARFKAILAHTAKDVGPSGPDFIHGYGLIQADSALRIAEEWAQWGHEATLDENNTSVTILFDVTSPMPFYKATLAWDDQEGKESSSMMLKNDLDLRLIDPNGHTYYPYDLQPPVNLTVNGPTFPCTQPACQDRLNNVEMVRAEPLAGDFVEQGQWQAVVDIHRLVSNEQSFSLVLSPACPIIIDSAALAAGNTITLNSNFDCYPNGLAPSGIVIEADDATLDCDDFSVRGHEPGINGYDGTYAGIRVLGDNVTVRNCTVRGFDVGIQVGSDLISPTNALLQDNIVTNNGTVGIALQGSNHTAERNSISQMIGSRGKGITVDGDGMTLRENGFGTARTGGSLNNTIGILVKAGTEGGVIQDNTFSGGWWIGIRLRSTQEDAPTRNVLVDKNEFEGIDAIPIELLGDVQSAIVSRNRIVAYGDGSPAIQVTVGDGFGPLNNVISANIISGFDHQRQEGIVLLYAENTLVTLNALTTVVTGISDTHGYNNRLTYNLINPTEPLDNYRSAIGIETTRPFTATTIAHNLVKFAGIGIVVDDPVAASSVTDNIVNVTYNGIVMRNAWAPLVSNNSVTAGLTAIALADAHSGTVSNNGISNPAASHLYHGIAVSRSDGATVSANTIISPSVGIEISGTAAISVTTNEVENPGTSAIVLDTDSGGQVDDNTITANSAIGIHYKAGTDGWIANNQVTSTVQGIGIQLGTAPTTCPVLVDNIVVEFNILTGGAQDIEVLCDVGSHVLNGNQ